MSTVVQSADKQVTDTGEAEVMSFTGHLEVLRQCIIKVLLAAVAGMAVSYFLIDGMIGILTAPAGKLYYMRPAEAFFIYLKIGVAGGIVLASPLIFYQFWSFVLPAFTAKARWLVTLLVLASVTLFVGGLLFAYFCVLPLGLTFFLGFDSEYVQSMLSMENYVDFVFMLLFPFGIIFELPLFLIVFAWLDIISSRLLIFWRKYVVLLIFVIAAVITPPDVVSQILMAVPMLLLYELSILFIRYILKK